ncbi:MAG: undecaprenyl-diphosphate phosphatase [Deferribacteraceae bacterium]|nr:undecaprenyl-diphosphate phosphatase [Deferribacteraceae bacterium]
MSFIQALILGIVQGFTEFLPVSSSGHLALVQSLFADFEQPGLLYDTLLHMATLLAVLVFFRDRIRRLFLALFGLVIHRYKVYYYEEKRLLWGIVIATIPTGIIGYLLSDLSESFFEKPAVVGYFLILTSILLFISDRFKGHEGVTPAKALFVGIIQGLAVFPGISRSGSTIFAGLLMGISRERAAEFSFLISIPAILGAAVLQIPHIGGVAASDWVVYIIGMIAAFLCGVFAIGVMMSLVKKARLEIFALYCLIVGIAAAIWM